MSGAPKLPKEVQEALKGAFQADPKNVMFNEVQEALEGAFRADPTPAANRVQIDAKLPRGSQHRCADREAAALAGGGEDNEWVLFAHGSVQFAVGSGLTRSGPLGKF